MTGTMWAEKHHITYLGNKESYIHVGLTVTDYGDVHDEIHDILVLGNGYVMFQLDREHDDTPAMLAYGAVALAIILLTVMLVYRRG